jgi:hypothetical protein
MRIARYGVPGLALWMVAAFALASAPEWSAATRAQTRIDFGRDVQPLLKERCYECHGPTK